MEDNQQSMLQLSIMYEDGSMEVSLHINYAQIHHFLQMLTRDILMFTVCVAPESMTKPFKPEVKDGK